MIMSQSVHYLSSCNFISLTKQINNYENCEIIGYRRANLGKVDAENIRQEGNVPCVLYGGGEQVHFYSPVILFRDIVYTNEAHFVHLNIEGDECQAILQEAQFTP